MGWELGDIAPDSSVPLQMSVGLSQYVQSEAQNTALARSEKPPATFLVDLMYGNSQTSQVGRNGGAEVLLSAVKQLPAATVELAKEAWENPWEASKHIGTTLVSSAAIGTVLGAIIPGKGAAAKTIAAAFTLPMLWHSGQRVKHYWDAGSQSGADTDALGRMLARETVAGTGNFAISLGGGLAGGLAAGRIATSETTAGWMAQTAQRTILRGENALLLRLSNITQGANGPLSFAAVSSTESVSMLGLTQRPALSTRLQQLRQQPEELNTYFGSLHGHSRYSDGMGSPREIYARSKANGQDFTAITDHNHLAARDGIKPGDPRMPDQAGTPILVASPKQYAETFVDAAAATKSGEFVGLVGTEHGTIGKVGADRMGGVNHINIFEMPTLFEAVRQPKTQSLIMRGIRRTLGMATEKVVEPDVVKIRDGDYKALVDHLDLLKDSTGGRPVIQLNHPRPHQDFDPGLEAAVRGRDYGRKSFANPAEWRERFGKYASQIEIITGEAMNPKPTDVVKSFDLVPEGLARYTDEGLYLSPTFGKDFHFGNPEGSPAGTGILASRLDKSTIMDALRARRTFATTSTEKLQGQLIANDRFHMGSILDETAVPDFGLKVRIAGKVEPEAQYTVNLFADKRIGDGKLASTIETRTVSGKELIDAGHAISFGEVPHKIGNKSAYWVEIQRVDPVTGNKDHMWTAPIWVQPGSARGLGARGLFGLGQQLIPGS